MSGIIFTCWKVRHMPSAAMSRERRPASEAPPTKRTSPPLNGSRPEIRLKVVDLPAPLGPISPTICPALIWKLMLFTATSPPNCLRMPRTSSTSSPAAGLRRSGRAAAWAQSLVLRCVAGRRAATRDHRPSGRNFSTSTSTMPNTMIS